MKFQYILLLTLAFGYGFVAKADDTTTLTTEDDTDETTTTSSTSVTPTTVWVTSTLPNGGVATVLTEYHQVFKSFYVTVAEPSSGSIGLGTLKGTVGQLRNYPTITLSGTVSPTTS